MTGPVMIPGSVIFLLANAELLRGTMRDSAPFKSKHSLQWQIVLVNPALLRQAQRRLRAAGPSEAIERALEIALGHPRTDRVSNQKPLPVH